MILHSKGPCRFTECFIFLSEGGRLSQELAYLKKYLKEDGIESDHEVVIQINKEKGSNILNVDALMEHLEMMKRVISLQVYVHH